MNESVTGGTPATFNLRDKKLTVHVN